MGRAQSALELSSSVRPPASLAEGHTTCVLPCTDPPSHLLQPLIAQQIRRKGRLRLELVGKPGIYGSRLTMSFSQWPSKLKQGRMVEAELGRRAASERPMQGIFNPVLNSVVGQMPARAVSTGPPVIQQQARQNNSEQWHQPTSFRDNGIYECNYESIGDGSSETKQSNQAIMKLEQAVRSIDQVLAKDISKLKHNHQQLQRKEGGNGAVQYDSITVLPTVALAELPPPPLPRTRSFRENGGVRARTAHPWGREASLGSGGGRASSAPPVSPVVPRRTRCRLLFYLNFASPGHLWVGTSWKTCNLVEIISMESFLRGLFIVNIQNLVYHRRPSLTKKIPHFSLAIFPNHSLPS